MRSPATDLPAGVPAVPNALTPSRPALSSASATPIGSFDHRDAGTSVAQWAASGLIEQAPSLDLTGLRHLIVIAAHPDDESLGAGGLIAHAAAAAVAVTVVVATAGEASHPKSPSTRPAALAEIRRAEVKAAVAALAPAAVVRQLDLGDGRLKVSVAELTGEIRSLVDDFGVETDSGAGTWVVAPGFMIGIRITRPPRRRPDGSPTRRAAGCWSIRCGPGTGRDPATAPCARKY